MSQMNTDVHKHGEPPIEPFWGEGGTWATEEDPATVSVVELRVLMSEASGGSSGVVQGDGGDQEAEAP
jgi:hypothetical protein